MKTEDPSSPAGQYKTWNRLNCVAVALIGAALCSASLQAQAKTVRDAAYCKRAGTWAQQELNRRLIDRNRKPADAIRAFGPDQLASKEFFENYASNVIYDESFEVYDDLIKEGEVAPAKKLLDFKLETIGEVAEELCAEMETTQ